MSKKVTASSIKCPQCNARAGKPCTGVTGLNNLRFHNKRYQEAKRLTHEAAQREFLDNARPDWEGHLNPTPTATLTVIEAVFPAHCTDMPDSVQRAIDELRCHGAAELTRVAQVHLSFDEASELLHKRRERDVTGYY